MALKIPQGYLEVNIDQVLSELTKRLSFFSEEHQVYSQYRETLIEFSKAGFTFYRDNIIRNDGCYRYGLDKEGDDFLIRGIASHLDAYIGFNINFYRGNTFINFSISKPNNDFLKPLEVISLVKEIKDKLWLWPTPEIQEETTK